MRIAKALNGVKMSETMTLPPQIVSDGISLLIVCNQQVTFRFPTRKKFGILLAY
jgi:hypothetical protein